MLDGRHDVQDGQALHAVRVVERQAVRHPGAAVVADHLEPVVPQVCHQFRHVARHAGLGVGGMVPGGAGLEAAAVAAPVRADAGVAPGQGRGDGVPHGMGLRVAVQQQHRRAGAAVAQAQLAVAHAAGGQGEAVEESVHAILNARCGPRLAAGGGRSMAGGLLRTPAGLLAFAGVPGGWMLGKEAMAA